MPSIELERSGPAAVVTIDNPDALNALAPNMVEALPAVLAEAARDRSCRAVIITGGTDRAFCAGIDVKSVAARDASAQRPAESQPGPAQPTVRVDPVMASFENLHHSLGATIRRIHRLPIPVIAAVNGHAIGVGFAIAAASDLRMIGDNARFTNGFVTRGISACELGLSYFLPRLVGASVAFEWMLTGRRIEADEAMTARFAASVGAVDTTLDRALEVVDRLAELAPAAVSMTKEVMWTNLTATSLDAALALESRTQALVRTTADATEARASFLEKRNPEFATPTEPRIIS